MSPAAEFVLLVIAIVLLAMAAVLDLAFRKIPNWLPLALTADGLVLRVLSGELLAGIAAGTVVFVLCALLWRRGLLGGGDVKLLGAAATVVHAPYAASFILSVSLAGGLLAVVYVVLRQIILRRVQGRRRATLMARIARIERRRICQRGSLPYACAIAAGAFFTLAGG
jgi:prepilin peptidase CpaA